MARPIKKVDTDAIQKLAQMHCTYDEIAEFLDVSTKTLQRNYVHLIKKGREMGKISLRRAQFEKAIGGNVAMMIWLGKQHLDQKDKIEQTQYNEPLPLIIEGQAEESNGKN
nr:putative DNA binding protein [uncultured Mediterranean phage uvMED]